MCRFGARMAHHGYGRAGRPGHSRPVLGGHVSMRRTKALPAIALVASASLVLSACGGGGGGSSDANGGDATIAEMAVARGESADGYTAPDTKQSDQIVVSTDKAFTAYNNATEDANQSYNTFALVLVQPG